MTKKAAVKKAAPPEKNRLRQLRTGSKLTLEEVAKLLDMDVSTISRHETGDRNLTKPDIKAYSRLYKVSSIDIFIDPATFAQ